MEVYTRKNMEAASLLASGPELVVNHGDNTPPDADFERVKMVAEMVG